VLDQIQNDRRPAGAADAGQRARVVSAGMSRHVVATVDEVAPGKSKLVTVEGREIGLFNVAGKFYALANRCPHAGGALCEGEIVGLAKSEGPGDYKMVRKGEFLR